MKRIIYTKNAPEAVGPYSQAVELNGMLFVSGQICIDPRTGQLIEGGIREQTARVLENLDNILVAAGYHRGDVVKCTCLLRDMNDFAAMNEVYDNYFGENPPARAAFQAARLPLDVLLEIEAIAAK